MLRQPSSPAMLTHEADQERERLRARETAS